MAYEYKKLSEVEAIDVADSSVNLIVETEDEIKKLNIGDLPIGGQEQADWNEEDETKASFIKNKPDLSQVGGSGGEAIFIKADYVCNVSSWEDLEGNILTPELLLEKLQNGANVYIASFRSGLGDGYQTGYENYRVSQYRYLPAYTNMSGFAQPSSIDLTIWIAQYNSSLGGSFAKEKRISCYGKLGE